MKNIKKQTKFVIVWGGILKLRGGGGDFPPKGPEKKALSSSLVHQWL